MRVVTIDFETFWSKTHSLSKMLPLAYVMHPETELISMSIKVDGYNTDVFFGERAIRKALGSFDLTKCMVIGHNMSGFDSMILAWRLGVRPRMWGCTLAMARPIHQIGVGNSLSKLVEHYQLGKKDNTVLMATQGKHLEDFTEDELAAMRVYNRDDTDQCYALFHKLRPHYSSKELWHIDATIRMLVEPGFVTDTELLDSALIQERANKRDAVLAVAAALDLPWVDPDGQPRPSEDVEEEVRVQMASAAKFGALLVANGVEVPMKPSPTNPDKQTPALAKTDQLFLAMQDHENPIVAAAARARLAVKSTLLETRIGAFLEATQAAGGRLPIPLHYCGATTTGRWSGWAFNAQNLPAIRGPAKPAHALRNSMKAPPGHKVVVADLSGIELRVNHFLWRVQESMVLYAQDAEADLYKAFAAVRYRVPLEEVAKPQRQLAKVAQLGLGFGAGAATFKTVAKTMGGLDITQEESEAIVAAWRAQYAEIAAGWKTCHARLKDIYAGGEVAVDPWGLCVTSGEGVRLPSGRVIRYPALRQEVGDDGKSEWWYGLGRHKTRIYAGKITENLVQALARDIIADNALDVFRLTGKRPALMVHDELVYLIPDAEAQEHLDAVQQVMRTPPTWWPELVTWSEGDIADTYGAAK